MPRLAVFGVIALVVAGMLAFSLTAGNRDSHAVAVTVYKSPLCGCCGEYINYLKRNGFDVNVVPTNDMDKVKTENGIPYDMQSCHTMTVGGYFVEGHVPIEAVNKMLKEKPAISGIALPGMPAGSPGMPGIKRGEFVIYSIANGSETPYKAI